MRFAFFAAVATLAVLVPFAAHAQDQVPRSIPYEGTLDRDGEPFTGNDVMEFDFYGTQSACSDRSTPDHTESHSVDIYAGVFEVLLGASSELPIDLFREDAIWIAISVDGTALTGCQRVGATPFSVRSNGDVPIGTIIDWWRPNSSFPVPDGYQICNGGRITDSRSPLEGSDTPNLVGNNYFVRAVPLSDIGTTGGSDTHNHQVDPSTVSNNVTGSVNVQSDGAHRHLVMRHRSQSWQDGEGTDIPDEAIHRDGSNIDVPYANSTNRDFYSNTTGGHTHGTSHNLSVSIDVGNTTSSTESNVPEWYGLVKLVRIY